MTRENIEDGLTVLVVALLAFIIGIRIEAVYLHDHEPVECSAHDEVPVELTDDAFGNLAGTAGCVHVDALEIP